MIPDPYSSSIILVWLNKKSKKSNKKIIKKYDRTNT